MKTWECLFDFLSVSFSNFNLKLNIDISQVSGVILTVHSHKQHQVPGAKFEVPWLSCEMCDGDNEVCCHFKYMNSK